MAWYKRVGVSAVYARTTPLILLIIFTMTVVPAGFRVPSLSFIVTYLDPWEMVANFFLFFPLGLSLQRLGLSRATYTAALLSMALETAQFFLVFRNPSPEDVSANTLGALCGAALGRRLNQRSGWRFDYFRVSRVWAAGAALLLMTWGAAYLLRSSLWTWEHSSLLAVGDELTGNRAWEGEIDEMAILDGRLDPHLMRTLADQGPGSLAANRARLPKAPVFELLTPHNVEDFRGHPLLQGAESDKFLDALLAAGEVTILVWCRPERLNQFGPARIVTYSRHPMRRNFTLGQEGRRVVFRVRTLVSGLNAIRFVATTPPLLKEKEYVLLVASYDGQTSRIYVNGQLASEQDLAAPRLFWQLLSPEVLPAALVLMGTLLGITLLGFAQPRAPRARWCLAVIAGAAAALLFLATGGAEQHPLMGSVVALFGLAGAFSLVWGSRSDLGQDEANRARPTASSGG